MYKYHKCHKWSYCWNHAVLSLSWFISWLINMYLYGIVVVVDRGIQQRLSPFPSTPLGHSWLLVPLTTLCRCGTSTPASKSASYLLWCSYILYKLFLEIWHKVLYFVLHLHSFKFLKYWKLCKKKKKKKELLIEMI